MINNDQSTLLLYCCKDVKSHRSGGDTVPLKLDYITLSICIVNNQMCRNVRLWNLYHCIARSDAGTTQIYYSVCWISLSYDFTVLNTY